MAIKEIGFASCNCRDTIKGWIYTPIIGPRAVVQLVHGFGEHSRRYMHMVQKMLDAGFVVGADDHVGHGKTAYDSNTWGDPGDKGFMTTIEDENTLRSILQKDYPGLPYVMFGHSWGSMIAQAYAATYGVGMAGAVFCGTAAQMKGVPALSKKLQAAMDAGKAKEPGHEYMGELFAGMTDRYENPRGPNDWIAASAEVVADHGSDPFNNLSNPPTTQMMYDFVMLHNFIEADDWAGKVPKEMPLYLIAGDQDPVGNYGEGVYHVANQLWNTGHSRVTTRIYTGYRHEIHNEPPIRDEVEDGIVGFVNNVIGA